MIPVLADYRSKPAHLMRREGGKRVRAKNVPSASVHDNSLVSIITVVYNSETHIEQTIQSVLNQSYTNIEYIIVDGASTDGTLDIIRKYENKIAYWVSEPDKGIADAWNKGIAAATGDIIGILNAGDYFDEKCIQVIVDGLNPNKAEFSYGKTIILGENNKITKVVDGHFNPKNLTFGVGFMHPSCFATQKVYEAVGLFNSSYRMAMDCDWIFRCFHAGISFKKLHNISYMRDGGLSRQFGYSAYGEYLQSMRNNGFSELRVRSVMMQYSVLLLFRQIAKQILRKSPA